MSTPPTLHQVNTVYLKIWKESVYTNITMVRAILDAMYPEAGDPWMDFLAAMSNDVATTWQAQTRKSEKKGSLLKAFKKPDFDTVQVNEKLWKAGNGLCTAFTICVNETAQAGATYVDFNNQHRAAQRGAAEGKVLMIDSAAGMVRELAEGEEIDTWKNIGEGQISWREFPPIALEDRRAALTVCFEQLWKTGKYLICYYRNGVQNGKGVFGRMVMFSPFHKAFRIVSALAPQTVTYIVFGEGKDNYQSALHKFLEDTITGFNDADRLVVGELVNVFAAATELWGAPRWSRETPLAKLSSWPEPVFDD